MLWLVCSALVMTAGDDFEAPTREWVEFEGYSKDGRLAAYRRDVDVAREDGSHDQYTLMHTVDAKRGYAIAVFQTAINRIAEDGRPVKMKRSQLAAEHPEYQRAYPSKRWMQQQKRERFRKNAIHTDPNLLQIALDEGVDADSGPTPEGIVLAAGEGSPLGFQILVHGADGTAIDGGTYRRPADAETRWSARVQAYTSPKRQGLAVLVVFMSTKGERVETTSEVKVLDAKVAKGGAPPPQDEAPAPRVKNPMNTKIDINAEPKFDPENRKAVDPKERAAIERVYRRFMGK